MSEPGKDNDPFAAFESDRTVIKPSAGRVARPAASAGAGAAPDGPAGSAAAARPAAAPAGKEAPLALDALMTASLNPLVSAASPLLSAAPRIRAMVQHPNPVGLKDALADMIKTGARPVAPQHWKSRSRVYKAAIWVAWMHSTMARV